MATFDLTCVCCHKRFTAKRDTARYCGPTCARRWRRAKAREAEVTEAAANDARSDLVDALVAELTEAGALQTFDGRLAVELAKRVSKAGPQGYAPLARELRGVRAAALGMVLPLPGEGDAEGDAGDEGPQTPDPGVALVLDIESRVSSKRAGAAAAG